MKMVISMGIAFAVCQANADVQKIQYIYDDSNAEYAIVSFVESGTAVQATVKRSGAYFTNYTKLELDCTDRNVRHMGMYNSLEGLEKAEFDQMQGRIVEGSIADEVGKILCKATPLTATQTEELPAEKLSDDKS
ncbi:hypothetical protein [Pseudomonas sp. SWRI154]|uniref:hypothetical protein n=1 Tax=Pseudomonas sp. SWRI154 TaxID=2745501 RepID=UPI00164572BF|nr:hypothetical protein [Pseudomonas sp. SWRI154]MBC3361729.1 hypothetical protein [Pseudomonas sp. SWRI154]